MNSTKFYEPAKKVRETLPATSDCESSSILQHSNCSYSPHHCRKVHALSWPFPHTFETHLCCHCLRTIAWILLQLLLPQHCCTWQQHVCKLQNKLSSVQTSNKLSGWHCTIHQHQNCFKAIEIQSPLAFRILNLACWECALDMTQSPPLRIFSKES